MNTRTSHIIHKLTVDIEVNTLETANEIKNNSNQWIRDVLTNALSEYFTKVDEHFSDQIVELNSLTIELAVDHIDAHSQFLIHDEMNRTLDKLLTPMVNQKVSSKENGSTPVHSNIDENFYFSPEVSGKILNKSHRTIQSFIYFLESGNKPWWIATNDEFSSIIEEAALLVLFRTEPELIVKAFKSIIENLTSFKRLVSQFSLKFNWQLATIILSELRGVNSMESNFSFDIYKQLIGNDRTKTAETTLILLTSIYRRNDLIVDNFEIQCFQMLCKNPALIFKEPEVTVAQIFKTVSLISAFSQGKSTSDRSLKSIEISLAKLFAMKLESEQIKKIVFNKDNGILEDETLRVLRSKLEEFSTLKEEDDQLTVSSYNSVDSKVETPNEQINESPDLLENLRYTDETIDIKVLNEQIESSLHHQDITKKEKSTSEESKEEIPLKTESLLVENSISLKLEKDTHEVSEPYSSNSDSNKKLEIKQSQIENSNATKPEQDILGTSNPNSTNSDTTKQLEIEQSHLAISKELNTEHMGQVPALEDAKDVRLRAESHLMSTENEEMNILFCTLESSMETSKTINEKYTEQDFLAENGGLILVHPFLVSLFKNVKYLNEENALIEQDRAIHLLHFLATGNQQVLEHHLIFEKYLCNLPLNFVTKKDIILSEEEMKEAHLVLNAVKEHWKKMSSSSVELLQNEFLKRNGKVIRGEKTDRLKMEKKPFDLLMDSLPWSINMVKLPWKKELIFVEW